MGFMDFLTGSPQKNYQVSTLGKEQVPLKDQLVNAGLNKGAGGAFGTSADYYRGLLSDDSADFNAFAAPEMRRFNEQTVPDLAEQFAGMGSGGLSSSGFRNAAVGAGTDLSERLGSIRANLRSQGAQGLQNIGSQGLQSFYNNVTQPATSGFLDFAAQGLGTALGGPIGGALGGLASNLISSGFKRNSNPYGDKASVSGGVPAGGMR